MPEIAIETTGLVRSFGREPVLQGLNLQVPAGYVYGLLGPNGAGKTTLVRILATLLTPHGGTARVVGHDVVRERQRVRGAIGLTGQYASVDDLLTGEENLVQLARLHRMNRKAAHTAASDLLERFQLTAAARSRVATYSGGMRRRLDLAASLLSRPAVLFLDEPTTGLDPRSRRDLWETIAVLAREGTTILLTTQYLDEADHLADRIGVLDEGQLVVEGTADELKRRIGQELLTVTVAPEAFDRAAHRLDVPAAARDTSASSLSLPLRHPEHLREVLNTLAAEDIAVHGVQVNAPTLDDVFLALTDRPSQEAAA